MKPFELYEKLRALIHSSRAHFIEKAEVLHKLYEKKTYKKATGEESWMAFLADPQLSIAPSVDFMARKIYRKFIVELGFTKAKLAGIDYRKLDQLANFVTKKNAEDWLLKAQMLSRSDFVLECKGRDIKNCLHKNVKTIDPKTICKDCGERVG